MEVSKLCKDIDERVHAFLDRPLAGEWPYLWLAATYLSIGCSLSGQTWQWG
jgi:putative transposase